jgi:hypothetical protein
LAWEGIGRGRRNPERLDDLARATVREAAREAVRRSRAAVLPLLARGSGWTPGALAVMAATASLPPQRVGFGGVAA